MKKLLIFGAFLLAPVWVMAAGGSNIQLDSIEINMSDKLSLQRGMQLYVNNCLGCHSAQYQRYERAAADLDIPHDLMREHLIFSDQKIGEQMINAMDSDQATGWFGALPPDLTNEVNLRGADWIYTYLRSFYLDDSRPYGVNNIVFPSVGMPNVLIDMQGVQNNVCDLSDSSVKLSSACLEKVSGTGDLSTDEFDQAMYDLTNFMAYMSKPYLLESQSMGLYVILFLLLMTTVFYFLYKEYWRDIHKD